MASHPTHTRLPALAVGMFLGTTVMFLLGVSMFVRGPEPSLSTPEGDIATAVTPTEFRSAAMTRH